ncbi:MAG: hypothetical protein HC840_14565 [Leptolyngbyaceae cyanobacterium RM2_2_4]|nr:hypothetical protein [Leptolyngbyaceae cyanobacterium RM2_2_4]
MKRLSRIPVRIQLTVWYVLLLGLTLSGFTSYIYLRLENKLMIKVDTSLQIGAAQALLYLDPGIDSLFKTHLINEAWRCD